MDRKITKRGVLRLLDVLILGFILVVGLAAISHAESDPENLMVVKSIAVADHAEGESPSVLFHRTVKKAFKSTRVIEVYSIGEGAIVCNHNGAREYAVEDGFAQIKLPAELGDCPLTPGEYVARVRWIIQDHAELRASSDIFRVYPAF